MMRPRRTSHINKADSSTTKTSGTLQSLPPPTQMKRSTSTGSKSTKRVKNDGLGNHLGNANEGKVEEKVAVSHIVTRSKSRQLTEAVVPKNKLVEQVKSTAPKTTKPIVSSSTGTEVTNQVKKTISSTRTTRARTQVLQNKVSAVEVVKNKIPSKGTQKATGGKTEIKAAGNTVATRRTTRKLPQEKETVVASSRNKRSQSVPATSIRSKTRKNQKETQKATLQHIGNNVASIDVTVTSPMIMDLSFVRGKESSNIVNPSTKEPKPSNGTNASTLKPLHHSTPRKKAMSNIQRQLRSR